MDEGLDSEITQILSLLQEELDKAEATVVSLLNSIVAGNAVVVSELEAALTDAEAALSME